MNNIQVDILEIYFTKVIKERRLIISRVGGKEVTIPWLMWVELVKDGFLSLPGNEWDIIFLRKDDNPLTPYTVGVKNGGYIESKTGHPGFWVPGTEVRLYWGIGTLDYDDPNSELILDRLIG